MRPWPGHAYPLGATYDGAGTNFTLFSEVAERVELCLFSARGKETRVTLPEVDGFVWHGYLPSVEPGQRYGFRVYGPADPARGLRCNPPKLLVDPYAKALDGPVTWDEAVFGYPFGDPEGRNDDGLGEVRPEVGGGQPVLRLGNRPLPAHPVPRDRDLRGARARPHRQPPGDPRGRSAAPTRAWRTR